ncbi:preprotein translocase subunit SecY [Peptococcaceae bacterium]|nr:preprotein translocase subunit SecY [Peptococcaceae bacterium]
MLDALKSALKSSELRQKLLFTLAMILVYRIAAHIPVPGVDPEVFRQLMEGHQLLGFFDVITGGAFMNVSVVAMGVFPYINALIIIQLLTVVIPKLEQLAKEGEEGRRKITQYTRYFTVVIAFVQAIALSFFIRNAFENPGLLSYLAVVITLTAGTIFLMWLGERITEKGIGNGISILIFAAIVAGIPGAIINIAELLAVGAINVLNVIFFLIIGLAVVVGIVIIHQAQRRIPVQYTKRVIGRRVYGGQTTHLPIKVNQAGVIPVIFASSVLIFPETIIHWFGGPGLQQWFSSYFGFGTPINTIIFVLLIIGFTYFYTAIIMNPVDMADNIKRNGGFIPGIRPGRPTAEYIAKVMSRITLAGAVFLALIAVIPFFVMAATQIPGIWIGGVSALIVVGVALDTMRQMESHLLMRSYKGFIK